MVGVAISVVGTVISVVEVAIRSVNVAAVVVGAWVCCFVLEDLHQAVEDHC
jgi:hypothetical protein